MRSPRRPRWWAGTVCVWALAAACNPTEKTADAGATPHDAAARADAATNPDATNLGDAVHPAPDAGPTTDAAARPDAGVLADARPTADAAPSGPLAPPADTAAPALFDPDAPGAEPLDAPVAALLDAWHARPTDEASAQANAQQVRDALAGLVADPTAAADRIATVCAGVPVQATGPTLECLRLLSLVDSPRSLDLLADRATVRAAAWPAGAHPLDPPPEALASQVALQSLVTRTRAGTQTAGDLLLRLAIDPANPNHGEAVEATLRALPRSVAKRRLREALPPEEHYRLYQTR